MSQRIRSVVFVSVLLAAAACGDDGGMFDAGGDGAAVDGGRDSGRDAAPGDAGDDAGPGDAGGDDGGKVDAGGTDAGEMDAGEMDAGEMDAGEMDAGEMDAGEMDAGGTDAGGTDAGGTDAGTDGGGMDAGGMDAGFDAGGMDAGPACPDRDLGMMTGLAVAMGTTVGGGDDFDPSCPTLTAAEDVALLWTAPAAGSYIFDTIGSAYDTVLLLLDGASCADAELACNDDIRAGFLQSRIEATFTMGQQVVIVVDGFNTLAGNYVLNITAGSSPETACGNMMDDDRDALIDCADPDCLASEPACTETGPECMNMMDDDGDMDVDCADSDCEDDPACTEEGTECMNMIDDNGDGAADCADTDCLDEAVCDLCPNGNLMSMTGMSVAMGDLTMARNNRRGSCGGSGRDVGYTFTAPATAEYTITTEGSTYDTVLYVRALSCNGPELVCNDDAIGTQSRVVLPLAMGEVVVIVVDAFSATGSGTYRINITQAAATYGPPAAAGDLVITEIMQDPQLSISDANGEWFELFNDTATTFNLNGCRIFDLGSDTHTIAGDVLIRPGEHMALARTALAGFAARYVFGTGITLANADDEVVIECGSPAVEIDRVVYDGGPMFPDPTGRSMNLDPASRDFMANDIGANWCAAPDTAGTYDPMAQNTGTPGRANVDCP